MDQPDQDQPLEEIETVWSDVRLAHRSEGETRTARARLVLRYIGAVQRYVARVLRDDDAAADLAQEFAVRVLRGDFRRADPSRGRFRDFVRTAALNLVHDYRRRCKTRAPTGSAETSETSKPVAPQLKSDELDSELLRGWRSDLFSRAIAALAAYQRRTGRKYHDIISLRTSNPELTSTQMAALISAQSGKPVSNVWVRQILRRARECLADLLLDEVSATLEDASLEELEQELISLNLLGYCHESLRRRARRVQASGKTPSTGCSTGLRRQEKPIDRARDIIRVKSLATKRGRS
jgi:RNA polymerase sigma factor (sigma-70 family)